MYAWHDTETSMTINESWRQYANKSDIRNCFIRPNFLAWYNENKKNLVDILTENNQVLENKLTYLNTLRLQHQPYTDKNIFGGFHVSFPKHWLKNGGRYVKVKTQKMLFEFPERICRLYLSVHVYISKYRNNMNRCHFLHIWISFKYKFHARIQNFFRGGGGIWICQGGGGVAEAYLWYL